MHSGYSASHAILKLSLQLPIKGDRAGFAPARVAVYQLPRSMMNEKKMSPCHGALSVGNVLIDDQHERIFNLSEEIAGWVRSELTACRQFRDLLVELEKLVAEHFASEEEIMERNYYPRLAAHRAAHAAILARLRAVVAEDALGKVDRDGLLQLLMTAANTHMPESS